MNKKDFPKIHFYDQDFVDMYDKTWALIDNYWHSSGTTKNACDGFFVYPSEADEIIDQYETVFSTFFLVYSNKNYNPSTGLDYFYSRQEENGAIRARYNLLNNTPIFTEDNPEGLTMPLFAWAEFNIYHKTGNKKRVKEVLPLLLKHTKWIEDNFKSENGLYRTPLSACNMGNTPREDARYLVDFNACMAINVLYISALGDILNDKEIMFQYKRTYFTIKTRISDIMWNAEDGFYYDLDDNKQQVKKKTIATFWTLFAEIPNVDKANTLISHLENPESFGTEHPFPSLAACEKEYSEMGEGYRGSVFPILNFVVIKGLEKYEKWELAREYTMRHLYSVLGTMASGENSKETGILWESYLSSKDGKAIWTGKESFPRKQYVLTVGLSTITLMIENIIGLLISLPKKTVDWTIPVLELMGIENLSLKRNFITIIASKSQRGWEIHMESEKLYYFTINIINMKKKTLPIPSGKCSMFIDKI
ncbi:MAG: MGH1-like glycoside hydrolase domain-containing protein [Treponema sp.]